MENGNWYVWIVIGVHFVLFWNTRLRELYFKQLIELTNGIATKRPAATIIYKRIVVITIHIANTVRWASDG